MMEISQNFSAQNEFLSLRMNGRLTNSLYKTPQTMLPETSETEKADNSPAYRINLSKTALGKSETTFEQGQRNEETQFDRRQQMEKAQFLRQQENEKALFMRSMQQKQAASE